MNYKPEFLTYVNGRIMPHSEALPILQRISGRSSGGYYDSARTFGGAPFKLRQHIERLYNGLIYSRIDPGISVEDLVTASLGLVEANRTLLDLDREELVVTQTVTVRQPDSADDLPTVDVAIYCGRLDFSPFARSYVDGVRIYTPTTYPEPPAGATSDGKGGGAQVFPLMTNSNGFITECRGANFMFVEDGRIKLPDRRNVLPGVSMQTVLELAARLGLGVDEGLYSPARVYAAVEAFVSSTRYCLLPVATVNGFQIGDSIPGPVSSALLEAWKELVGVDFVDKALRAV